MLKYLRIFIAILSITAVTLLFVDFTGTARTLWPWMAKIQFLPALFGGSMLIAAAIIVATLIFGRVYCSVVCPLGIFQDVVIWLRGKVGSKRKRRNRFRFSEARVSKLVSYVVFGVFFVCALLGMCNVLWASIAGLIDPYSAYGRMASQIFAPAYDFVNNLLAAWSESRVEDYTFYPVAYAVSIPLLAVAIVTMVVVVVFAWTGGRNYCNTICPVGTILGAFSKFSFLKPVIDTSKCINCGKCGRNCKSSCIDTKHHAIDYRRCVVCFDCIGLCSEGAISYTMRRAQPSDSNLSGNSSRSHSSGSDDKSPERPQQGVDKSRRGFVSGAGFLVGAVAMDALANKTGDGGFTPLLQRKSPVRATPIVPAGAQSIKNLESRCTACQLCVQSCPNHVLKPNLSLDGFMQPHIDFSSGWCDTQCNVCSTVCPAGAIAPIDLSAKSSVKVGTAVVSLDACISASQGKNCGNCASRCPAGAISMVPSDPDDSGSNRMPVVNESVCIGCGACEYHCPVGTVVGTPSEYPAIHVEGVAVHREI